MSDSVEHVYRCRIGPIPNHHLLELENETLKTNCDMLSIRPGPCVSLLATYLIHRPLFVTLNTSAALFSAIRYRYIVDLTARSDFTCKYLFGNIKKNTLTFSKGGSYNIEAWSGAEGFVMIVCGNIPPLKPLWDRFVAGKLDSNYGHDPINYNMEKFHSKLSSTAKTSSSGDTTRILPIQHGAWSQNCSQTEAGSKAYTEINAIESANEV